MYGLPSFFDGYCGTFGSVFLELRGCLKHNFLKKGNDSSEKKMWPHFSHSIEDDKCQQTVHSGTDDNLTNIVYATI